jgi:phosphoribosylformylglycinamidine synthase
MSIAAGSGATIELPAGLPPTAMLFGERAGRVIVSVASARVAELRAAVEGAGVEALAIGRSGGAELDLRVGPTRLVLPLSDLEAAWRTPFPG